MERKEWVDIARGYAILSVVFMHSQPPKMLVYFISAYSVPAFFVLSGYLFSYREEKFVTFLIKRANRLLVPYFGLGSIVAVYQALKAWALEKASLSVFKDYFCKLILQQRYTSLWFITCLFWAVIAFWLIVRVCKGNLAYIGWVCTACTLLTFIYYRLGGEALPWNIDASGVTLFFLWVGYALKSKEDFVKRLVEGTVPWRLLKTFGLFAACAGLTYLSGRISGEYFAMASSAYGIEPLTMLAGVLGSLAVFTLASAAHSRYVKYVGANSMVYFAFNQSIVYMTLSWIFSRMGIPPSGGFGGFIRAVVSTVLIQAILFPVERIISKTKLKFLVDGFETHKKQFVTQ